MTTRSPITTHVLDVSLGRPAAGIGVALARANGDDWHALGTGETDADGRASQLLTPGALEAGTYRLRFTLTDYFTRTQRTSFYPHVDIVFVVAGGAVGPGATGEHYHVPLLLSPFGYSTYRGS